MRIYSFAGERITIRRFLRIAVIIMTSDYGQLIGVQGRLLIISWSLTKKGKPKR
jgi:hypothetical protein